ncbi:MAG: hypothetical protein M0R17_05345 [Candidatus Omnitrophica bacterium]|nr:hypothetical protein [Candidatus Omnitrophota bacterium]
MKQIKTYLEYNLDSKNIIIISNTYKGSPKMYYKYDILIGSKEIITKYKSDLVPEHLLKTGWKPKVVYL